MKWSAHGVLEQCLVYYICAIRLYIYMYNDYMYNDLLLFVYS